jgi:hypothetical protein
MNRIATLIGREPKWSQPHAFKMEYELRAGDEVVATLRFDSAFKARATGESADGRWRFDRLGMFCHRVVVTEHDSGAEILSFTPRKWGSGGVLEFPDGRTFHSAGSVWGTRYTFTGPSQEPLFELRNCGVLHHAATLHIARDAARVPELPLLVILGWYLDVMAQSDAAGVTMIAAT